MARPRPPRWQPAPYISSPWIFSRFANRPNIRPKLLGNRLLLHDTSPMPRTIIHVNQHVIRRNNKTGERNHVLSVKRGRTNTYASSVAIHGPSRVVYSPDCPLNCGARVWIETEAQVDINDTPEASCLLQHPTGQPPSGQVPRRNAARQRLGDEGTGIE